MFQKKFQKVSTSAPHVRHAGLPHVRQEARTAGRVAAGAGREQGVQMALVGYRDSVLVVMRTVKIDRRVGADGGDEAQGKGAGVKRAQKGGRG